VSYAGDSEQDSKALAAILDNIWFALNKHGAPPVLNDLTPQVATSASNNSNNNNNINLCSRQGLDTIYLQNKVCLFLILQKKRLRNWLRQK
jgi:hypothetical protein